MSADQKFAYRHLAPTDCPFILQQWAGHSAIFKEGLTEGECLQMIADFNTKEYRGQYFEMFGFTCHGELVGVFSLYQRPDDVAENALYLGIEIAAPSRRKGYATHATAMAFDIARHQGYSKLFSQARVDNIASVKLHAACGFQILEETYSARGFPVYNYVYFL